MTSFMEEDKECLTCELQDNLTALRGTRFFSYIPVESLKIFAYLCTRDAFKAGDKIFIQGEDDGRAFCMLSGSCRLVREGLSGERLVSEYRGGDFLGGLSLLGNSPRLFSAVAVTDCTCLVITREKFQRAVEQFPDLYRKIFKAITGMINDWEEKFLANCGEDCECSHYAGVSVL